jgi:pimeloyl-ACP methyl ester carboxylesterase
MIPTLAEVGRVIVPDLIGFGRSDKPVNDNAYSYRSHAHFIQEDAGEEVSGRIRNWLENSR